MTALESCQTQKVRSSFWTTLNSCLPNDACLLSVLIFRSIMNSATGVQSKALDVLEKLHQRVEVVYYNGQIGPIVRVWLDPWRLGEQVPSPVSPHGLGDMWHGQWCSGSWLTPYSVGVRGGYWWKVSHEFHPALLYCVKALHLIKWLKLTGEVVEKPF